MPHVSVSPSEDELLGLTGANRQRIARPHHGPHLLGVDFTQSTSLLYAAPNPDLIIDTASLFVPQIESIAGSRTAKELGIQIPRGGVAAAPPGLAFEMRRVMVKRPDPDAHPFPFRKSSFMAFVVPIYGVSLFQVTNDNSGEKTSQLPEALELLVTDDPRVPKNYLGIGTKFLRKYFALKHTSSDFFPYKLRVRKDKAHLVCPSDHVVEVEP